MDNQEGIERGFLRIRLSLDAEPFPLLTPLPCDKYLASSAMQKAIRRRDEVIALRAAASFFRADRKGFWRRISLIALEDCSIPAYEELLSILAALSNPAWRKRTGEEQVALTCVRLLCRSTKLRLADQLYSLIVHADELAAQREEYAWKTDNQLSEIVRSPSLPLLDRALALWFLAGTKRYPHDQLAERSGSLEAAQVVMKELAPAEFSYACGLALRRSEYPLALWTPLIWSEVAQRVGEVRVVYNAVPNIPDVEGVPAYAVDRFTRIGGLAIQQFRDRVPDLRQFTIGQIGLGVFYVEGGVVDRELTSNILQEYKRAGEIADGTSAGLHMAEYLGMKDLISGNIDLLQQLRLKLLMDNFVRWKNEQEFEGGR